MIGKPFSATIEAGADTAILHLSGDINRFAAEDLDASFRGACATGAPHIALDFSGVDYLNSTGIALIVGILGEARSIGVTVVAWGLSDHFREIFEITRIVEFMTLYDDETAARDSG